MRGIDFIVVGLLAAVATIIFVVPQGTSPPAEATCEGPNVVGAVLPITAEPSAPAGESRVIVSPEERAPAPSATMVRDTALDARVTELEAELALMKSERDRLLQEIECCRYPEDTPWGIFLRLPDSAALTDPEERRWLQDMLETFPVQLLPGEAIGLVQEVKRSDTATHLEGTISYLGAERIQNEIPPDMLKSLAEWMGQDDFAMYFVARNR